MNPKHKTSDKPEDYAQDLPIKADNDGISMFHRIPEFRRFPSNVISLEKSTGAEYYKNIANTLHAGFWEYNDEKNVFWVSDELFVLLGLPENTEIIDIEYFYKIVNAEERFKLINFFDQLNEVTDTLETDVKITIEINNQKIVRILHTIIQLAEKNNSLYNGVVVDVTEKKKYEEELLKIISKTEESDRLKSNFLTNMSHEIRTPMNSILGFTELLNIGELTFEKKKEFLSIIKNKSRNLLSLIDDIIELAKFEAGELRINKCDTNLNKILTELNNEFLKEKIRQNKDQIELYLSVQPEQKILSIYTDPGRVQQVLSYLLDNALKYTEKGYIQFGYELKDSKHIQLFVKDTGSGIPKDVQKHIFNRFKYKEDTVKTHATSGLSLSIAKAIVDLLGGKISVESVPGQGSTFTFTLPVLKIEKAEDIENVDKETIDYNWKNKVILIAEDEEINFKFLEAVLANTQARLLHVNNGQQAVELCKTINKIDLVLMDIKMPEMNGYEAIREIKAIKKEIPIIAQTAYTFKDDKFKCQDAGCDDYISKPIDIDLLYQKINKIFSD